MTVPPPEGAGRPEAGRAPAGKAYPVDAPTLGHVGLPTPPRVPAPAPRRWAADFLTELFRSPLDPGYAAAARRNATRGAPDGPAGRRTALGVRVLTLVLVGFLLAVAYQYAAAAQPDTDKARAGLVADVKARRSSADGLQKQDDQLRQRVSRERDEAIDDSGERTRLRDLEAATGTVPVRGSGVVVTLSDGPPPVDPVTGKGSADNPGRVLDRDLQAVSNQLWQLGAEAIAINGERLTATSTIRAAGDAILVDFRPVTAPYEVSAIGPADLADTFGASATARQFRRYVSAYRMKFSVRQRDDVTLPAAGEPSLRYARPPVPSASPSGSPVPSRSGGGK